MRQSNLKPQRLSLFVCLLVVFGAISLGGLRAVHAEDDPAIEAETATLEAESMKTEEDEARRAADAEKARLEQEQEIADRETARAQKTAEDAKAQVVKYHAEEKSDRAIREAAEKKTAIAKALLAKTEAELKTKTDEYDQLKNLTEKTIAERDATEAQVEKTQDKIAQVDAQMAEKRKQKAEADAKLSESRQKLAAKKAELKLHSRVPSSSPAALAKSEGWVKMRRPCGVRLQASDDAVEASSLSTGQKLYAKKVDDKWLQIKVAEGTSGYIPIACAK